MQQFITALFLLAFATLASAHYALTFPYWRGSSFATQWEYPCGGVNQSLSDTNRTLWPFDGGAIALTPTHHWAQTYINLGLGRNVTRFNITLMAPFNQTSNGTFCLPDVKLPDGLTVNEGDAASIQVVQLTATGGALYNCADITFSKDAKDPGKDVCFNSTGVGASVLDYDGPEEATTGSGNGTGGNGTSGEGTSGAGSMAPGTVLLAVGMVAAFMM